ncbi:MAG: glycosyltransferase [Verrucomicrobia bacterium]|nr:glycosyltransferase [Verrucomicrobiota bacterium]
MWQRPQQYQSRLARRRPVLFVEAPVPSQDLSRARWQSYQPDGASGVTVLQTELPEKFFSRREQVDRIHGELVRAYLATAEGGRFLGAVQWFYDPMQTPVFAGRMEEVAVVYDCMDQLSQFHGAPPELIEREAQLLELADVVFAGGPKMAEAKRLQNPNCHSFGCGVEVEHFERALDAATVVPADLAALPEPRLGFFGVVDERMDYELLDEIARQRPDWQIVLVGPHCKVDPANFPQRTNLHFVGPRTYTELPACVRAFSVCLMPFAINAATEFINPTKALEYMASGRPIVSTPVQDVVRQFGHIVSIADSPAAFIARCEEALEGRPEAVAAGRALAAERSWERNVEQMEQLIEQAIAARASSSAALALSK